MVQVRSLPEPDRKASEKEWFVSACKCIGKDAAAPFSKHGAQQQNSIGVERLKRFRPQHHNVLDK